MSAKSDSTSRAIDFVFDRLEDVGFHSLNIDQQRLICVWAACGEINNGGIWQFFFNSSGDWSTHTPAALEVFDAPELAAIIRSALAAFPDNMPSTDLNKRRQEIDALPDELLATWDDLSTRFDTTSMDPKIDAFIRKNQISIYASNN